MVRRWVVLPLAIAALAVIVPVAGLAIAGLAFGWTFQPIETRSMEPRYPAGSLAVVVPVDPAEVEPGMTIVFEDPMNRERLVAHRVVRRLPGDSLAWETKGDANATSDPLPVHAPAVRGRVSWSIAGIGSVVTALRGPQAVVLLVLLPLAILVVTELLDWRRRRAPRRRSAAE